MKMKLFTLCLAMVFSAQVFSYELELGGQIVTCKDSIDVRSHVEGYTLFSPVVELSNGVLNVKVNYMSAECKNVDGKIAFYPKAEVPANDRILLENPRLFSVDTFYGVLGKTGLDTTSYSVPVESILSKRAARKYRNGSSVTKTFYLRYGNHFDGESQNSPMSYGMSSGYYTLTIKLNQAKASVVGFSSGRN
jgi:hypothetical protein